MHRTTNLSVKDKMYPFQCLMKQMVAHADSGRCRSAFRDKADHYSVLIPIMIPL